MAESPLEDVVSHWHKLFGNFQTSTQDFYASVERGLESRKIPGLKTSRVKFSEGGVLSPDREYLRVTGDRHTFDMCAAPFGTGYFFSSWVTKKKPELVALYVFLMIVATIVVSWLVQAVIHAPLFFGLGGVVILYAVAAFIVLWVVALMSHGGARDPEAAILTVPLIGWVYARLFVRETYYRIDTMLMFQSAVHSAMMEAIDAETNQQGARSLTEDERKPIFRELFKA